jgi:sensor histidine kinase YesM
MISHPLSMPEAIGGAVSRSASLVAATWRAVTAKHVVYTFAICLAWSGVVIATQTSYFARPVPLGPSLNAVLSMQFNGFAVMFAVLAADHASPPQARTRWPYLFAVVLGVAAGSTLLWFISQHLFAIVTAHRIGGSPERFDTYLFRHATHSLVVCGLTTFVYVSRRWAGQRRAALRMVQLGRVELERKVLESRLAAMQARVEPQFLRSALAQVQQLYEIDVRAADRVLKELIVYLRAAIPQIRDPATTVAREIRLANAYLNVIDRRSSDWLLANDTGRIAHTARIPPMILLPLINHARANHMECVNGSEPFRVDVTARNNRLELTIRDQGDGFSVEGTSDTEILQIREQLATLYGDEARLTLKKTATGTEAVMELPYELVADTELP